MKHLPLSFPSAPLWLFLSLLSATFAAAPQPDVSPASTEADPRDHAQLVMSAELAQAEARADSLTAQLRELDADIEARIARMISLLASVRDSNDGAGNRIRKAKEEALDGIRATALYYAQERDRRTKALLNGGASAGEDVLARQVAALNARIETRVTQSLAIAESLVALRKGSGGGDFHESAEQRKLRYDAQASVSIKEDLVKTLRAGIDRQTREIALRDDALRTLTDPGKRTLLEQQNETARQLIEARRSQIETLLQAAPTATRPVGSKAAFELDQLLDEMTAELRRDFGKFKGLVAEGDAAHARVKMLRARLAAPDRNTAAPARTL